MSLIDQPTLFCLSPDPFTFIINAVGGVYLRLQHIAHFLNDILLSSIFS